MKTRIIFTILISIIITLVISLYITGDKGEKYKKINQYDYICTYETDMIDDEGEVTGKITKNLYLVVEDNYVSKATYESIYKNNSFSFSTKQLTQELLDLYNDVYGIETALQSDRKNTYVRVTYDYNKINFKYLRESLESVLDKDSLQMNMKGKLSLDEYVSKSSDYKCQKK